MKKIILAIMTLFFMVGCNSSTSSSYPKFEILYFYIDGCGLCSAFSDEGIPLIESEFDGAVTIQEYNLDDIDTKQIYDEALADIDVTQFHTTSYYGLAPMIIVEGHFAKLGIYPGEYEELVNDIQKSLNDEPLGQELEYDRALYKK